MSWISIVFYILTHLPELIGIIKNVLAFIKGIPKPQANAVRGMLSDAIQVHKATKDASQLKRVCIGIGCAPDLA